MTDFSARFLDLSVLLTGFDAIDLQGTGLVDDFATFIATLLEETQPGRVDVTAAIDERLQADDPAAAVARVVQPSEAPSPLVALFESIVLLWYLGAWQALPDSFYEQVGGTRPERDTSQVFSVLAYEQGLAWRVACAHPPGARPTGYGGWGLPPVVPDVDLPPIARGAR